MFKTERSRQDYKEKIIFIDIQYVFIRITYLYLITCCTFQQENHFASCDLELSHFKQLSILHTLTLDTSYHQYYLKYNCI